jgi:hypothetical protein
MDVGNKIILIHPRCKNLLTQLQYGTWDKNHTKFSRSSTGNHWDLLAALVYFVKHVDRRTNPYPVDYGIDKANMFNYERKRKDRRNEALSRLFPVIRRR